MEQHCHRDHGSVRIWPDCFSTSAEVALGSTRYRDGAFLGVDMRASDPFSAQVRIGTWS